MDSFILDTRIIKLSAWYSSTGESRIFDERFSVFYIINPQKLTVQLVTPSHNLKIRIALMRVIREFAMSKAINDGGVFIHGSAFSINQQGIIIAGRKRAGKTTLLLHNLHDSETQYVSNDRILISLTNTKVKIRGMPSIVSIEPSSLANFPQLQQDFFLSGFKSNLTENEAKINPVKPTVKKQGKYSLTPGQLCSLLKTTAVSEVEAKAIIFPHITQSTGTIKLSKLSLEESVKKINTALLSQGCEKYQSDAFIPDSNTTKIDLETLKNPCQDLVSLIPCYQCELGTLAYKLNGEKLVDIIKNNYQNI